jgi:outer membrane lipoprotein-sorting protein
MKTIKTQLNEIMKKIQDMKVEFNKEIESLKRLKLK